MQLDLAFIGSIGLPEMIVIGIVALLIFGSRLPEVGRSLGKGLMEFKKGLSGIKDEVDTATHEADLRIEAELEGRRKEALPEPDHEGEPGPRPEEIFQQTSEEDPTSVEDDDTKAHS